MTKKVWIHIVGSSDIEDEGSDLLAQGTYYLKNGTHYLLYEGLEDESVCQTTQHRIKISADRVEVMKRGGSRARMLFEPGNAHCSEYDAGCGVLLLTFATDELRLSESEDELRVTMKYRILFEQMQMSENRMEITVTPYGKIETEKK